MGTKGPTGAGVQHTERGPVQGTRLVGPQGLPIDVVVDGAGKIRLAVDANVTIGSATVNVDLESDTDNVAIRNTGTDDELLIYPDGTIKIRLTDASGTAFSVANPLPVSIQNSQLAIELNAADGDNVAISAHPVQIFDEDTVGITTAASYTAILTYTATSVGTNISFAEVCGTVEAQVRLKLNGIVIRQKRLNGANPNIEFPFLEPRTITTGDVVVLEAKPDKAVPAFMTGGAEFFASLQGFVD